jgi:hypothetical protein
MISKIQDWIKDEYKGRVRVTRDEDYDPKSKPYLLTIKIFNILGQDLPVSIVKPKGFKNKIAVYSGIVFNDEQQKSFHELLDPESRDKIILELRNGLAMMSLVPIFIPEEKKFKQIAFQELIYFDGVSQDRVLNSLNKIVMAYSYIFNVLRAHNILRDTFDASKFT